MPNFWNTFKTLKRSFICAFSICMTVFLTIKYLLQVTLCNIGKYFLFSHFLLLFRFPKGFWNKLKNIRNFQSIPYIALGIVRDSNYILYASILHKLYIISTLFMLYMYILDIYIYYNISLSRQIDRQIDIYLYIQLQVSIYKH